jgi:glutamate/tyrosine decarboxylase-like PLP-dependent enzyme
MSLDFSAEEFRKFLYRAADLVVEHHQNLRERKIYHGKSPDRVKAFFDEPLPESANNLENLLATVQKNVVDYSTLNLSPHFMSYVMSGANQVGVLALLLEAGLNQNSGKWHLGASAAEIELWTIRWLAEFIGYPVKTGGIFVSGGSMANLTCLMAARKAQAPFDVEKIGLVSGPPLTMYVCAEGHSCLDKSLDFWVWAKISCAKFRHEMISLSIWKN